MEKCSSYLVTLGIQLLVLSRADVSGGRTLRNLYGGVVGLQVLAQSYLLKFYILDFSSVSYGSWELGPCFECILTEIILIITGGARNSTTNLS